MEGIVNKAAIVTGASSGIGLAISQKLCLLGYEVYGIGRNFETSEIKAKQRVDDNQFVQSGESVNAKADSPNTCPGTFYPVLCDLLDTDKLCKIVRGIAAEHEIDILVNNAGVGYYGLHEELNPKKIQELVRTNLEVPMILAQQLLRDLKKHKGCIINIASVTAGQSNPHGCAYGATKAGLVSFSRSLFDEARKYGVKVVAISPDMTCTNLYRNADFEADEAIEAHLLPEDVAEAVSWILSWRESLVVTELTLKPQLHRIKRKGRE